MCTWKSRKKTCRQLSTGEGGFTGDPEDGTQERWCSIVNASFDVAFDESGEAGMFPSEDHRFQQQPKTHANLKESHSFPCASCTQDIFPTNREVLADLLASRVLLQWNN
jgi:hypothetical protein